MNTFQTELNKLYMNKIMKKTDYQVEVNQFINKYLPAEERYIELRDFIRVLAKEGDKKIKTPKKYPNKWALDTHDKIKHLCSIETSVFEAPKELIGESRV